MMMNMKIVAVLWAESATATVKRVWIVAVVEVVVEVVLGQVIVVVLLEVEMLSMVMSWHISQTGLGICILLLSTHGRYKKQMVKDIPLLNIAVWKAANAWQGHFVSNATNHIVALDWGMISRGNQQLMLWLALHNMWRISEEAAIESEPMAI
jgi:hypothetical protein